MADGSDKVSPPVASPHFHPLFYSISTVGDGPREGGGPGVEMGLVAPSPALASSLRVATLIGVDGQSPRPAAIFGRWKWIHHTRHCFPNKIDKCCPPFPLCVRVCVCSVHHHHHLHGSTSRVKKNSATSVRFRFSCSLPSSCSRTSMSVVECVGFKWLPLRMECSSLPVVFFCPQFF